ncbi:MAG: hypothetical protein FWE57_00105 [Chitinispirillia bacterium]|nr:hypothetical protein [Chitinispirillia bacterium]
MNIEIIAKIAAQLKQSAACLNKNFRFVIPVIICALISLAHAGFDPAIRLDPQIDRFIQRIEARYGLLPAGYHRQPMGTESFLSYLDSVSQKPLSASERHELSNISKRLSIDNGIYGYYDEEHETGVIINLGLTGESWGRAGKDDKRGGGRGIISPMLRGHIGKVSFYSGLDVWTEYVYDSLFYQSSWQPYDGNPYTLYGRGTESANMRAADFPRAGISYTAGRIDLQAGLDYLRMGPAVHYPVTLSGEAPPIAYFRTIFDLSHFEYSHFVGFLRSERDKSKYIYSNRLSGNFLGGSLQWGISEVMIAGEPTNQQNNDPYNQRRPGMENEKHSWEWVFCIPFVPMVFVEHYVGDKSNAALSFDASLNWPQNFRFYGEFFIDDMLSPWKIFSDDWGNKWAVTAGVQYFSTLYSRDISAGIEYSRVEPWVYTHFYGGSHRYDHFDISLGSPLGPNSRAVVINGDMNITKKSTIGLSLKSLAKNSQTRGGKITDIFQEERVEYLIPVENYDSETKRFLGPGTVNHLRPGVYGYYDPSGPFRINASAEIDVDSDRGNIHLRLEGGFRF